MKDLELTLSVILFLYHIKIQLVVEATEPT